MSPDTFPAHLVLGGPYTFSYGMPFFPTGMSPESHDYCGFATLVAVDSPEPIPEPRTLLLVGGGLAALVRRRLRG